MTTYTQEQREELIAALREEFTQDHHHETISLLVGVANMLAAPSTSQEVDMPTEAEVAMDSFCRITEQTVRADQLQALAIDYAEMCGELSKGLSPLDKEWIDLRDLGARLDALAEHNFKVGA